MRATLPPLDGIAALRTEDCIALRDVCARVGYTNATLQVRSDVTAKMFEAAGRPLLRGALLGIGTRRTDLAPPAGVLAGLFACRDEVEAASVRSVLGRSLTDALVAQVCCGRVPTTRLGWGGCTDRGLSSTLRRSRLRQRGGGIAGAHPDLQCAIEHFKLLQPPRVGPGAAPSARLAELLALADSPHVAVKVGGVPSLFAQPYLCRSVAAPA